MAALGSQSIASSYEQLLHVDADGGGNSTTHVSVKDGDNGTTFALTLATDAVMITSTNRLEFGDNASYIHQSADGVLDLVSDTEIEINATTIDINGAVDISGNATLNGGTVTLAVDTDFVTSGGVNGMSIDGTTFSVDGANNWVGIGTAAPGEALTVQAASGQDARIALWSDSGTADADKWRFTARDDQTFRLEKDNGTAAVWSADASGNVGIGMTPGGSHKLDVTGSAGLSTGTAWTNTSDERIKINVETIENGLDKINQLRPVSFNYSEDYIEQHPEINASKKYNSFIAQEYADVFPDAVSIGGDLEKVIVEGVEAADGIEAVEEEKEILVEDVLQFTPHDLNMYLVAAVKELSAKVEALEG
jgi:hypothetical protein